MQWTQGSQNYRTYQKIIFGKARQSIQWTPEYTF